jgi:hypothetical protein
MTTRDEVHELAERARTAFRITREATPELRIAWLEGIADALEQNRDELVAIADEESRLGAARLNGEVTRTTGQLRAFAAAVREGSYREATIDHADPAAVPPRPELRRMLVPIGPVAVFSASNFPFAFSVAGGDTASALAVGCPVIVKGHSAHPRLSQRTADSPSAPPTWSRRLFERRAPPTAPSPTSPAEMPAPPSWSNPPSRPSASPDRCTADGPCSTSPSRDPTRSPSTAS